MTIQIVRNTDGNCITFRGSTNPAYWNACLSAEVDPTYTDRINVINDIATADQNETIYEFYQLPYTEFRDADNNPFANAADTAAYITAQGNVIDVASAQYAGLWNAITNTPELTDGDTPTTGTFYFVSNGGSSLLGGVASWRRGDKVIWNGSSWQKLQATSVIDGSTFTTLLNTQTSVFADGEGAITDPDGAPGWYYSNTENNKINWYVYGDTPTIQNQLGDLNGFYAIVTPKNTTSEPYFSVYTKPEGDGNDQSWYRSRVTYYDQTNLQTMVAGTKYLIHNGASSVILDAIDQTLPRISMGINSAVTEGPQGAAEELFMMALSTSSGTPAGTNDFIVEKIGYVIGDHQNEYELASPPTTGPSTSDETPSTIDFRIDGTGTTILANDGKQYGVNSLHAIANGDGTIDIVAVPGQQVIYDNLIYGNVTITDSAAGSTENGAVNALNALFENLPLGAGGSYVVTYPTLDATDITYTQGEPTVPTTTKSDNTTVHLQTVSGTSGHDSRLWSTETIDQAGEYYLVKIVGNGRFIIGLGSENDGDDTEIVSDSGTAHSGLIWGQAFYDYGSYSAPWTIYGSSAGLSYGPGWNGSTTQMMRYNGTVQDELTQTDLRDGALFKIGIDQNGYIACWYYDAGRSNEFILTSRRNRTTPAGNYFLVVKLWDQTATIVETPQRSAVDPAAPALAYRYIESPDGAHTYPLFASADEAAYVDEQFTGTTGEVTAHVFIDEPTASVWYKPVHVGNEGVQFPPSNTDTITYTEIPTNADNLYAPAALNIQDYTFAENTVVNFQIHPQDSEPVNVTPEFTLALSNLGLSYNNGFITGTTSYVIRDTPATVAVSRSNSYGTTTETFGITITDNASLSDIAGFTETQGNFVQPDRIILGSSPSTGHDALLQYNTQINPGEELTYSYGQIPPTIGILSATGEANLAAFNPATDTLGTISGVNNFAETANWDLRYVSFGGYIGANSTKHSLVGWVDNSIQTGAEGTLTNVEFKLEYGVDGYFRLYVGGTLKLTSLNTFSGAQTLTLAAFNDQQQSDVYIPANWTIVSSVDTDTPPTGFVDPVESGEMSTNTLFGPSDDGAVFLTETLKVNHRYIVPQAWIEANVLSNITDGASTEYFFFGVPKDTADFSTINELNNFHGSFRLGGTSTNHNSRIYVNGTGGTADNTVFITSTTDAYYDYAIEWDGTDLHVIACNIGDINTQPGINNGGSFSRVVTLPNFGADHGKTNTELNLVIAIRDGASVNLTTTGLQQIRIPFGIRDVIVGEASGGGSMFALAPAATVYDTAANGHASTSFGMSFDAPTLDAGYTYRFIYHPSMEAGDDIKFTRTDDGTDYTLGVTFFDGTSAGDPNFTDGYKGVTFVVPSDAPPLSVGYNNDYQGNTSYALKPLPLSGSTYTVEITGVTQIGPAGNQTGTNWSDVGEVGFIQVDELVGAGERITFPAEFFHDLISSSPGYGGSGTRGSEFRFGFKDTNFDVNNFNVGYPHNMWEGGVRLHVTHSQQTVYFYLYGDQSGTYYATAIDEANLLGANVRVFFEITNSGNSIRAGISTLSAGDDLASTPFSEWSNKKANTGDQSFGITTREFIMMRSVVFNNTPALDLQDINFTVLGEVPMPSAPTTLLTDWNKALDFSGNAERAQQVDSGSSYQALKMGGVNNNVPGNTTAGYTASDSNARPWATACVFQVDGNSSNQHIWNLGEGSGSTDDNIYLRLDASRNLYFGWGRTGSLNECQIAFNISTTQWYGVYIAHTGERLGDGHAAGDIADCFDIRVFSSGTNWQLSSAQNVSTYANWSSLNSSFGARMNRQLTGYFTVGGRGANRNFHGKIASMVTTTLRLDQPMPSGDEVRKMVIDPRQWLLDYKIGQPYRLPASTSEFTFAMFDSGSAYGTQVWLMGDGPSDAYAQVRNHIHYTIQNIYPLNMVSMVSNDIQTVNIPGLT